MLPFVLCENLEKRRSGNLYRWWHRKLSLTSHVGIRAIIFFLLTISSVFFTLKQTVVEPCETNIMKGGSNADDTQERP